jgi:hypothetical protein
LSGDYNTAPKAQLSFQRGGSIAADGLESCRIEDLDRPRGVVGVRCYDQHAALDARASIGFAMRRVPANLGRGLGSSVCLTAHDYNS